MNTHAPVIYVLDASVAVTGAFTSIRSSVEALKDSARFVLVLPKGSRVSHKECSAFSDVKYIPLVTLSKRLPALLGYLPALMIGSWQIRKYMKRDGSQQLLLNDFYLMHSAVLRVLGFRGRIITWVRCEPERFAGFLARPMLAVTYLTSNTIVTVSHFIQGLLPKRWKVAVLHDDYSAQVRATKPWAEGAAKNFLYVGNYIQGKGQDMALEAFAIAARQDPSLHLTFIGGDMGLEKNRAYRKGLVARAAQLHMEQQVTFGDFVADTYPLLETAYAALNCSVSESFSRTVLEASGAGVAVIATMSGGPQEIIRDEETGYLIPVGDVTACAERIVELARDPAKTARMGEAGAKHIAQHFSAAKITTQLKEVLGL
ncbi:MAG: glycosyltransferase family 4 protein [Rickettsiales bacterium]